MKPLFHTILNPTDFSECATAAHQLAVALARVHGSRLVLLHVTEPIIVPVDPAFGFLDTAGLEEQIRAHAGVELRKMAVAAAGVAVKTEIRYGHPVSEILAVAKKLRADLIVMGTHGRTGLSHLMMGSTAEKITRSSPCPVLTVRTAGSAPREVAQESGRRQMHPPTGVFPPAAAEKRP